jgi:Uma2 family endonuclease
MFASARKPDIAPVTIEAFDAFLETDDDSRVYELIAGVIIMMSNPSEPHEKIASNIGISLGAHMRRRKCHTYQGGMRVQRHDDSKAFDKYKPDVLMRFGTLGTKTYSTDPIVMVEVLSRSTIDFDRGPKLEFFKTLPTLQHIVLAYQDQMRLEHYRRAKDSSDGDAWVMEVLTKPEQDLQFAGIEFTMPLVDAYQAVVI